VLKGDGERTRKATNKDRTETLASAVGKADEEDFTANGAGGDRKIG